MIGSEGAREMIKPNIEVKAYLLERKRATTRTVRIVTDQKNLPKEEALGR